MAAKKKKVRVARFKFDPSDLMAAGPVPGKGAMGDLLALKEGFDAWCRKYWAPALDAGVDENVDRMYTRFYRLARAVRDSGD